MHVQSTLNPNSTANVPLAIFVYENRRKFLVKAREYEDTLKTIRQAFGIRPEQHLVLRTSSLDVCRDRLVDIDAAAYPHLWHVLDEVTVAIPDTPERPVTRQTAIRPIANGQSKARVSNAVAGSASASAISVARQLGLPLIGSSKGLQQSPTPVPAPQQQPQVVSENPRWATLTNGNGHAHRAVTRKGSDGSLDVKDYQSETDLNKRNRQLQPEEDEGKAEGGDEYEEEYEDEEYEVHELANSSGHDLFRDGQDIEEVEDYVTGGEVEALSAAPAGAAPGPSRAGTAQPASHSSKRGLSLEKELFPDTPPPPSKKPHVAVAQYTVGSSVSPVKQERTSSYSFSQPLPEPEPVTPQPRGKRFTQPPSTAPSASTATIATGGSATATADDGNKRIAILITGPDEDTQSAQFKMRGRHMIHKILKSACGNFGLDFPSSKLYLVKETLDEEGNVVDVDYVWCANNKTAMECGLTDGAKLIIEVEE